MFRLIIICGDVCISVVLNESLSSSADLIMNVKWPFTTWKLDFGEYVRLAFSIFSKQVCTSTFLQ